MWRRSSQLEIQAQVFLAGLVADEILSERGIPHGSEEHTAIHEAAHAVVGRVRGKVPVKITIEHSPGAYGHVRFAPLDNAGDGQAAAKDGPEVDMLSRVPSPSSPSDQKAALIACVWIANSWRGARSEFWLQRWQTAGLLRLYWRFVEAVARELLQVRTMSGADFERVMWREWWRIAEARACGE